MENTAGQGTTLGRNFEELAAILEAVGEPDRLGICLDTCHLFVAGYDISTAQGYRRVMTELDSVIGVNRIRLWHLNDSRGGLASHLDRHEHIGRGQIGPHGFRHLLKDARFFGIPKILETPKANDMDRENLKVLYALK